MASTKQERMLAKSREAAQARNSGRSLGQSGASGSSPQGASRSANQYSTPTQKLTPVYLTPSFAQPRAPSPPPEYEESPFRLVTETNRDVDIREVVTPVPEHLQPKEFADGYNYHHELGDIPNVKSFWRTRKGIIAVVVISNVVILCAILGGVLGSMSARKSSSGGYGSAGTAGGSGGYGGQAYTSNSSFTATISTSPVLSTLALTSTSTPVVVPASTVTATVIVPASSGAVTPSVGVNPVIGPPSIPEHSGGAAGNAGLSQPLPTGAET